MALAFAASAGAYAITQQRTATRAAVTADASRLGALARSGGAYDRSLLLAAQAMALDPSPATESDLFATLLRGDAVVATLRAAGQASAIAFTPDSRSIVAVTSYGRHRPVAGRRRAAETLGHLAETPGEFLYNGVFGVGAQIAVARDGQHRRRASPPSRATPACRCSTPGLSVLQDVPANAYGGWALSQDRQTVAGSGRQHR